MGTQRKTWAKPTELVWLVLRAACLLAVGGIASAQNPIVIENQLPGTSQWQIPWGGVGSDATGQVKGFASAVSVNKGQNVTFYVSVNPAQNYTIDVFRMGWYQGLGARLMQHIGPLKGVRQTTCPTNSTTGMIECHWAQSYTLATQTSWTSGIYLALLTNSQNYQNYIIFAVRDDGRSASFLFQQPVTTYQAYNDYPWDNKTGKSLYAFNSYGANTVSGGPNAVKVSFDRPYSWDGTGGGNGSTFLQFEYQFLRWVEMSGYDVTYSTDVDTHLNGSRLLNYRGLLSVGHDEYWSRPMYDAFMAARDAGVNLGFFDSDAADWQVRFEPSSSGVPNRVLVCYRYANLDPISDPSLKTVEWHDPILNRPPQTMVGVEYASMVGSSAPLWGWASYVVTNSGNWVYAGTGFRDGDQVPYIVGYEADKMWTQYPTPNALPGTYTLLSNSPLGSSASQPYGNSSVYQAPSGAWVFATGANAWNLALDSYGHSNFVDSRIQKTTANVLNQFLNLPVNFSITASPSSQAVTQGSSTSYSVTVSPIGGFSNPVTLSVSGLPGGANDTFSPNPTTSSSTLSVTTNTTTPMGTYTLTITGTSGTLTHSTTVTFVVNPLPDFTLSASPSSQSVTQGGSTNYTVTASLIGGFSNPVNLSVSGLPSGANGTFSPNPMTASSALSVTTSTTTPIGTYTLTITGVSGSLTRTTTVTLAETLPGVKYDNSASSGFQWSVTRITTPSFLVGSSANRAAMIMVVMSANSAKGIIASLGGVAGTLCPGTDSGATATLRTLIFQVTNPPSGLQTATVSWTNSMNADIGVITVSGADQTTPCTNGTFFASNSSQSPATSVTIASSSRDLTASVGVTSDSWVAPFTNQALAWGIDQSVAGGDIGPGTGAATHTWTDKYSGEIHSVSGANFKAAKF
ncbi:MAG TPA: N,N-dimethylformamidase beta subunit family domain-containing protein [Candidatus Acidoferrum sp.]|nr:N,N-dimethylformamidase beta subunit family domain-containing protein [Candidatus Acidoferrum sp.]